MDDAVTFTDVSKSFGRVTAVDDLTRTLSVGESVALLGPNGAGKTTTIGLLLGLLRPDAGDVRVLGMAPDEAVASGSIAAMLQEGGLMPDVKVAELVDLVRGLYPDPLPMDQALETAGLGDLGGRLVNKLSGGQTQRLRFALALVGNPRTLVLDEPTAGLDVEARRTFWTSMRAYAASGRTVLFATHYLEEADENADRILVMSRGRVIADGPATEIKATVGGRTVRFTLDGQSSEGLDRLPGVKGMEIRGDSVTLSTADADETVAALYTSRGKVRDIEVTGADLEDAFLALTENDAQLTQAR
ncbi:MAG: ABC transporter ATP-binding protein [Streptosporangiaceae bacterium]